MLELKTKNSYRIEMELSSQAESNKRKNEALKKIFGIDDEDYYVMQSHQYEGKLSLVMLSIANKKIEESLSDIGRPMINIMASKKAINIKLSLKAFDIDKRDSFLYLNKMEKIVKKEYKNLLQNIELKYQGISKNFYFPKRRNDDFEEKVNESRDKIKKSMTAVNMSENEIKIRMDYIEPRLWRYSKNQLTVDMMFTIEDQNILKKVKEVLNGKF